MGELLLYCLLIAFKNTAVYFALKEDQVFGFVRIGGANFLDRRFSPETSKYIQKPLWDCVNCMSSLWTCIWITIDVLRAKVLFDLWFYVECMIIVLGMSVIMSFFLQEIDD